MIHDITVTFKLRPRALIAEAFGVAVLCYVAGWTTRADNITGDSRPYEDFVTGPVVLATMILITADVSGAQLNPAVSFGLAFSKRQEWKTAVAYTVAQLLGSILGGFALHMSVPSSARDNDQLKNSYPTPSGLLPNWNVFWIEFVGAFMLMYGIIHCVEQKLTKHSIAFTVFSVIAMNGLAASNYSGACFNPARVFGPSLVENDILFGRWYLYWVGPIFGAMGGILFHDWIICGKPFWDYFYKPVLVDRVLALLAQSPKTHTSN